MDPTYGEDEHGRYVASTVTCRDHSHEYRWYLLCPNCGTYRSGLLGVAHDFANDCPSCRGGPIGPTGVTSGPTSFRNQRQLAKKLAKKASVR